MNSHFKFIVAALGMAALLAGCGKTELPDRAQTLTDGTGTETFEVRLLGTDPGGMSTVLMGISGLRATADGVPLEITPGQARVELAQSGQAWLVGTVTVPSGTDVVDFSLDLDDAGTFAAPDTAGWINSRHLHLSWESPVESLRRNGHAVLALDLARSLVSTGAGDRAVTPRMKVQY
jgi:hypothetical protein